MPVEWDKQKRQYIRNGKPIPPQSVRQLVLDVIEKAKERLSAIATKAGTNRAEWFIESREELKRMHMALSMVAQGGRAQMNVRAWGRVGQVIKSEMEYLRGFERDIANGGQSDAEILARAIRYAAAGYKTYQNGVFAREKDAGVGFARRVLDPNAENCEDCPSLATDHFLPITEVAEIGASACGGMCRCELEFMEAA